MSIVIFCTPVVDLSSYYSFRSAFWSFLACFSPHFECFLSCLRRFIDRICNIFYFCPILSCVFAYYLETLYFFNFLIPAIFLPISSQYLVFDKKQHRIRNSAHGYNVSKNASFFCKSDAANRPLFAPHTNNNKQKEGILSFGVQKITVFPFSRRFSCVFPPFIIVFSPFIIYNVKYRGAFHL